MKKWFAFLICFFAVSPLAAKPLNGLNELSFKAGKVLSLSSDYKFNYESLNSSETDANGFSLKMDYLYYLKNYTALGLGINANLAMNTLNESFAVLNYYLQAKQIIPLNSYKDLNFYLSAGAGYGFVSYSAVYLDSTEKMNGGFCWLASCGFEYGSYIIEASYINNNAKFESNYGLSADVKFSTVLVSVGYKFLI